MRSLKWIKRQSAWINRRWTAIHWITPTRTFTALHIWVWVWVCTLTYTRFESMDTFDFWVIVFQMSYDLSFLNLRVWTFNSLWSLFYWLFLQFWPQNKLTIFVIRTHESYVWTKLMSLVTRRTESTWRPWAWLPAKLMSLVQPSHWTKLMSLVLTFWPSKQEPSSWDWFIQLIEQAYYPNLPNRNPIKPNNRQLGPKNLSS